MRKTMMAAVGLLDCALATGAIGGTLSERVAADFPKMPESGVCHYAVPALGERQYLPDAYPEGGLPGEPLTIVAARDEYEPASFVLYSVKDLGKVQFEVSDLKLVEGNKNSTVHLHLPPTPSIIFPKENIDIKTVKVWYQNGNGWYSYFQDVKLKLCPELLLHDEDLVRVDEKQVANYARLTEKDGSTSEFWVSAPRSVACDIKAEIGTAYGHGNDPFPCMKENFCDAPRFAGATLSAGRCKQFLLTVHVGKDVKPGLYKGEVKVIGVGVRRKDSSSTPTPTTYTYCTIPIYLRVLDFTLPKPKCYFDVEKDFETCFCEYNSLGLIMTLNGGDRELGMRQYRALLENYIRHGYTTACFRDCFTKWGHKLGLELGFDYHAAQGGMMKNSKDVAEIRLAADLMAKKFDREFGGHKGVYLGWGDEYGLKVLRSAREMVKIYHDLGFKFSMNSRFGYDAGITMADLYWPPVRPDGSAAEGTVKYNETVGSDGLFGWYANHHVGTENPAFNRRQYGFGPYRAGLSLNFNYAQHLDRWNDLAPTLYKPMMLVYGSGDGCIDTLAWEGFREGQDDIRYATKLKQLALPLLKSEKTEARYAARLALKLLADADGDDMDLDTLRLEMIRHIERLRRVTGEK